MNGIDTNFSSEGHTSPPPGQVESATTTDTIAGRCVTVAIREKKDKPSLLDLSSLPMIFRCLELRDICRLKQVCTLLRDAIKEDNAEAKAWYRRFPSSHQNQMRMAINTKNKDQLRDWFESFTNDQALVKSLTDRNPEGAYVPALFFFTKARLMAECKTFKLVTTSTIHEHKALISASLSVDGCHLVTACQDHTAKIYFHKDAGLWELKLVVRHAHWVNSATFSPDSQHLVTTSYDGTALIHSHKADGSWELAGIIAHTDDVVSASFSADSRHLVTASKDKTAKVYGFRDDGSWESEATILQKSKIKFASFSSDGQHLVTACKDKTAKILSQQADESWLEKVSIDHHGSIQSATFSPNSHYVVTTSKDGKAVIYGHKADGSWEPEDTIHHTDRVYGNFSPDSRYLVTASSDNTIKIFARKTNGSWKPVANISHEDAVLLATFSPDGRHVVTGSDDVTAKIIGQKADGTWLEKASISHRNSIDPDDGWITSAAFSADGSHVITAGSDGAVKITELRSNNSLFTVTE
ncbi:F-box/WD repeat-containing protein [Endozoicomonas sp. 2B-B]